MAGQVVFIFSLLLAICTGTVHRRTTRFNVNDCSENGTREVFTIPDLHIYPDPVQVPGNVTVWGRFNLTDPLVGNITLDLNIDRKVSFFWVQLPCLGDVGSCKYDLCDLLGTDVNDTVDCGPQLEDSDIPCTCPFQPGSYGLKHEIFRIPKIKKAFKSLAEGDFEVTIKLEDSGTDEVLACQKLSLTIEDVNKPTKAPCSFLGCLFG